MPLAVGDASVGIGAVGAESLLARNPECGFDLVGMGVAAALVGRVAGRFMAARLLDVTQGLLVDALRPQLILDPGAGAAGLAALFEEVCREAPVVDVAALGEALDDFGDPVAQAHAVLAGPLASRTELAPDGLDELASGLVGAREGIDRFVLEPRRVEGAGVAIPGARRPMRFHDLHATKSAIRRGPARRSMESSRGALRHDRPRVSGTSLVMPELPEVETTRRSIAPLLVGKRVERVVTTAPSYFFITPPDALRASLTGRTVESLDRVGKYLVAGLDHGDRVLLHLGMTGQLFSSEATSVRLLSATARASLDPDEQRGFEPDEHTHLRLTMAGDGPEVFFRDVRKFGKVQWLPFGEANERLDRLGVDALEVTGELLFRANRGRRVAIKAMLLDQSVTAGVGNIYADEALFLAGVRPGRAAKRVTRRECDAIAKGLREVLRRSIETGGSSISDYVAPDGSDGGYQDERRVYGRKGEPCLECGAAIKRRVIAQRSSHYCARCQS